MPPKRNGNDGSDEGRRSKRLRLDDEPVDENVEDGNIEEHNMDDVADEEDDGDEANTAELQRKNAGKFALASGSIDPPKVNLKDPSKLTLHFREIATDKEKILTFIRIRTEEINWDNKDHIQQIQNWRRQAFRRQGFPAERQVTTWQPRERAYIELLFRLLQERLDAGQQVNAPTHSQIAEHLNAFFKGKYVDDKLGNQLLHRGHRNDNMVSSQLRGKTKLGEVTKATRDSLGIDRSVSGDLPTITEQQLDEFMGKSNQTSQPPENLATTPKLGAAAQQSQHSVSDLARNAGGHGIRAATAASPEGADTHKQDKTTDAIPSEEGSKKQPRRPVDSPTSITPSDEVEQMINDGWHIPTRMKDVNVQETLVSEVKTLDDEWMYKTVDALHDRWERSSKNEFGYLAALAHTHHWSESYSPAGNRAAWYKDADSKAPRNDVTRPTRRPFAQAVNGLLNLAVCPPVGCFEDVKNLVTRKVDGWDECDQALARECQRALRFHRARAHDDSARNQIRQLTQNATDEWKKIELDANLETGALPEDSTAHKDSVMEASLTQLSEAHQNLQTSKTAGELRWAQAAWEDFFFYQNVWNRRGFKPGAGGNTATEKLYVSWRSHMIGLYESFRIGDRQEAPRLVGFDVAHRYSQPPREGALQDHIELEAEKRQESTTWMLDQAAFVREKDRHDSQYLSNPCTKSLLPEDHMLHHGVLETSFDWPTSFDAEEWGDTIAVTAKKRRCVYETDQYLDGKGRTRMRHKRDAEGRHVRFREICGYKRVERTKQVESFIHNLNEDGSVQGRSEHAIWGGQPGRKDIAEYGLEGEHRVSDLRYRPQNKFKVINVKAPWPIVTRYRRHVLASNALADDSSGAPLDQLSDDEAADCTKSNTNFSRSGNALAGGKAINAGLAADGNKDNDSDDEGDIFSKSYLEDLRSAYRGAQGRDDIPSPETFARAAELLARLVEEFGEVGWDANRIAEELHAGTDLDTIRYKYEGYASLLRDIENKQQNGRDVAGTVPGTNRQ
ncbi:hypothetical protein E8E12_010851 [Didymella heteroderae]|uniref:Uncharacterized protein n=1 Tax=Didymella heteroderae TaxID=1769908 RepID=A0A9P4WXE4_9PLEO|nr:hypothetical protein E8E12_010851 [Didymella heteroderae]